MQESSELRPDMLQEFNVYRQQILIHAAYIAPLERLEDLEIFVSKVEKDGYIAKLVSWDRNKRVESYKEILSHPPKAAASLLEAYKLLFDTSATLIWRGRRVDEPSVVRSIEE